MAYEHVTLCFSLPRSRSQWLAWLYGHAISSWHDPLKLCKHPLELKEMIDGHDAERLFIADTAAIMFHTAITESLPGARLLYVVRPPQDVCASLKRQTGHPRTSMVYEAFARLLHERCSVADEQGCAYSEVNDAARNWWQPITGRSTDFFPAGLWHKMRGTVIDVPLKQQHVDPFLRNELMRHKEPLP